MASLEQTVNEWVDENKRLNSYINTHGQIQRSSIIKQWHDWDNAQWYRYLMFTLVLDDKAHLRLDGRIVRDLQTLVHHIEEYGNHCDNIIYPHPKTTKNLHHKLTHLHRDTSVKSVAFRAMMNIREAYCELLDIDLPNADSSIGKLDPTPFEEMFE